MQPSRRRLPTGLRWALLFAWVWTCGLDTAGCAKRGGSAGAPGPAVVEWQRSAANSLMVPTLTATTIQWSVADPFVLHDTVDGKWKLWFSASLEDRASHLAFVQIFYAQSDDGIHWPAAPTVALATATSSAAWDYTHVETPAVMRNPNPSAPPEERWLLFYSGGNRTAQAAAGRPADPTYYQLGLAYSADGQSFTRRTPGLHGRPGLVLEASAALFGGSLPGVYFDGLLADPAPLASGGDIHLWFSSYAENAARQPLAFGISHAVSSDSGATWSFPQANPVTDLYRPGEVAGGQQPSVLWNSAAARFEMWFTNDSAADLAAVPATHFSACGFWRATSTDGRTWLADYSRRDFTWQPANPYENLGLVTGVHVLREGAETRAYFSSWGTANIPDTGVYFCPVNTGPPGYTNGVITLNLATR